MFIFCCSLYYTLLCFSFFLRITLTSGLDFGLSPESKCHRIDHEVVKQKAALLFSMWRRYQHCVVFGLPVLWVKTQTAHRPVFALQALFAASGLVRTCCFWGSFVTAHLSTFVALACEPVCTIRSSSLLRATLVGLWTVTRVNSFASHCCQWLQTKPLSSISLTCLLPTLPKKRVS